MLIWPIQFQRRWQAKMVGQFAFKVSLVDMIRKLRYRYANPIDYLDSIVERFYAPAAEVDIDVADDVINISSSAQIPDEFFQALAQGKYLITASVIPPASEFGSISIYSGENTANISQDRKIKVGKSERLMGTSVVISRTDADVDKEIQRLQSFYTGSDLVVTLQGEKLAVDAFHFRIDGFRGAIAYEPLSLGGIHYFYHGRRVSSEPLVSAVDIYLFEHPFLPTLTKTKMITGGKASHGHQRFLDLLPRALLEYLKSAEALNLRQRSETSYRLMLTSILEVYGNSPQIMQFARENLGVEPEALRDVSSILGTKVVPSPTCDDIAFDSGVLYVNPVVFSQAPYLTALRAIPHLEQSSGQALKSYRRGLERALE